ncbi:MAG TPA: TetR/AcrR family transcriptional regulator [Solirubrobacterales bacterium]|nr:TetR/AcrR family transcriptional regulator [Solirubrobacterales bacterium]
MAGLGDSAAGRARTPRVELARIRAAQTGEITRLRERIMEAAIEACGERGYREATVQDTIDRYGGHRQQFYKHFASKAECYAAAYEFEVERLYAALSARAAAEPSWHRGLFAILTGVAELICARPSFARGLLVEVHVAGGPALLKRLEVFERLTRAVDSARHETESRHSPPPVTATFMVGAIEAAVTSALTRATPQDFTDAVPELAHMVLAAYFGDDIAGEETETLRAA